MNKYYFVYSNGISLFNSVIESSLDIIDTITKFKAKHEDCVIVNIIKLDTNTPLTKEILDKNFKIDEEYKIYIHKTLIPYILDIPTINGGKSWNLIWDTESNILRIEDDLLIKIKTVEELNYILKLANANKEIVI